MFALVGRVPARGELIRHPSRRRVRGAGCGSAAGEKATRARHPPAAVSGNPHCQICEPTSCHAGPSATQPVRGVQGLGRAMLPPGPGGSPALTGWRRYAAAFAAGVVSVLAMAPFHVWPVLFITLPIWIWLIDGAIGHTAAPKLERAALTARRRWRPAGGGARQRQRSVGGSGSAILSRGSIGSARPSWSRPRRLRFCFPWPSLCCPLGSRSFMAWQPCWRPPSGAPGPFECWRWRLPSRPWNTPVATC